MTLGPAIIVVCLLSIKQTKQSSAATIPFVPLTLCPVLTSLNS
jgi:hypothetical protein